MLAVPLHHRGGTEWWSLEFDSYIERLTWVCVSDPSMFILLPCGVSGIVSSWSWSWTDAELYYQTLSPSLIHLRVGESSETVRRCKDSNLNLKSNMERVKSDRYRQSVLRFKIFFVRFKMFVLTFPPKSIKTLCQSLTFCQKCKIDCVLTAGPPNH